MPLLNYLSFFVGKCMHYPLPEPLGAASVKLFAKLFKINVEEAELPLESYKSIGEFFTRSLKAGVRPLGEGFVSPVDGTIRDILRISSDLIPQVKGKNYSLSTFLGERDALLRYSEGIIFNIYLAPPDYHCIHMPLDGRVTKVTYIPGFLWPVNDLALNNVSNLFAINERIILEVESDIGSFALVMVGATNVGKISLTFDTIESNNLSEKPLSKTYPSPITLKKGDKVGTFHLGSTVVIVGDKRLAESLQISSPLHEKTKIKMGQTIVTLQK